MDNASSTIAPIGVEIENLSHAFGGFPDFDVRNPLQSLKGSPALTEITCSIAPGVITGLVGRNGAGKTTLLSLIAALRKVQTGTIEVDGQSPWENPSVTSRICLMREKGGIIEGENIGDTFEIAKMLRPNWDRTYAEALLDKFEIPLKKKPEHLSRGKRSSLGAVIALASRAELTMLDEVYLGMDAVARRLFYDEVMADYVAHPRTIVLSSHLLDEVEDLFENVIVLDKGRVVASGECDEVRQRYSGPDGLASLTDVLVAVSSTPINVKEQS